MKNLLIELETHAIPHFVMKSYVTAAFETAEKRTEWHVYHHTSEGVGRWSEKDIKYDQLSLKKLSKAEVAYFYRHIIRFKEEKGINPRYGEVWTNRLVGFDKSAVMKKNDVHKVY